MPFLLSVSAAQAASDTPPVGPFFEPDFPFFGAQVQLTPPPKGEEAGGNFVVRGLLLPLPSGDCVLFDQELMRIAAVWRVPPGQPLVTLMTMAQISYANPRRKAGAAHPQPTGPLLLMTGMHPGVGATPDALFDDPRPPRGFGDEGRGALPVSVARFDGIELRGMTAVLHYHIGPTAVVEWHEARSEGDHALVLRHLEVQPHRAPFCIDLGRGAQVTANDDAVQFTTKNDETIATVPASAAVQRLTLALALGRTPAADAKTLGATPPLPPKPDRLRWRGTATAPAELGVLKQNGLVLDRIATPDENPWRRRVRAADLAFITDDKAAVVGYDGDVWMVTGFADPNLAHLTWRRFVSGLHEPLAIAAIPNGAIQVATKNGVVRLWDRDGDGEAEWIENFNDEMLQSQTTRSFPLDMAIGPDGSTFVSQGGIVTRSGLTAGGEGTPHTGAILHISPDGRSSEVWSSGAREPFVAVNPRTGVVTGTDQQGNYIPSSVSYYIRHGDNFGFLQEHPEHLTPALVWVPHELDTSSASEAWILGDAMGPWNGRLVHLSYGNGRLFIISPDLDAPIPQGAAIPLELKTDLPLLHARMDKRGDALYLAGFQIWGTQTRTSWALGRLRRGDTPIVTAIGARAVADGVILEFATPLDPASLSPAAVAVRAWNYKRSSAYGSGRYALDGSPGATPWGVAQVVASNDRKRVFVHLPKLPPVDQLEVRHDFRLADGTPARGFVYVTIHQPHALNLVAAGFPPIDMTKAAAVVRVEKEAPPTAEEGRKLAESIGCAACHSTDGTTEGKVGPTWKQLFGSRRTFVDGTSEIADETYIHDKILDPQQKRLKQGQVEMPSYRGVLSEQQIESIVLYIKTLRTMPGRRRVQAAR